MFGRVFGELDLEFLQRIYDTVTDSYYNQLDPIIIRSRGDEESEQEEEYGVVFPSHREGDYGAKGILYSSRIYPLMKQNEDGSYHLSVNVTYRADIDMWELALNDFSMIINYGVERMRRV